MFRTGSSLVAGILNRLGVNMGPRARLLAPNPTNPAGFWEHIGIIGLNEELLDRLGGTWFDPPPRPAGFELIGIELDGGDVWGKRAELDEVSGA